MLGPNMNKTWMNLFNSELIANAKVAKDSTYAFLPFGIYLISNASKSTLAIFMSYI